MAETLSVRLLLRASIEFRKFVIARLLEDCRLSKAVVRLVVFAFTTYSATANATK
jgi:hypothetical protein